MAIKYCQGPKCHEYHTKDRIRGHKGDSIMKRASVQQCIILVAMHVQ